MGVTVTPSEYGPAMGWNPWRELRRRTHLEFQLAPLPAKTGGAIYWPEGNWAAIVIDRDLPQRERNAALAHELVHDELGGGKEAVVQKTVARRLVPHDDLVAFIIRQQGIGEPVSALEVAEYFDVPPAVAERALLLLKEAWTTP